MIKGCSVERYDVDEGYGYHKADTIVASLTACTFAVFLPGHRDTLKGKFERCSKDTWLWRRYTLFPDPTLIVDGKKWGKYPSSTCFLALRVVLARKLSCLFVMFSISFSKNLVHYIIKSSSEGYQPTLLDVVHLHNASKGKEVCFKVKRKAGVHYHISSTGDGTRKLANEAEEAFVLCRTEETKGRVLWRARDKGVYICVTRFPMRSSHGGRTPDSCREKDA